MSTVPCICPELCSLTKCPIIKYGDNHITTDNRLFEFLEYFSFPIYCQVYGVEVRPQLPYIKALQCTQINCNGRRLTNVGLAQVRPNKHCGGRRLTNVRLGAHAGLPH